MGIEPTLAAWEAAVLPLNYTRVSGPDFKTSRATLHAGDGTRHAAHRDDRRGPRARLPVRCDRQPPAHVAHRRLPDRRRRGRPLHPGLRRRPGNRQRARRDRRDPPHVRRRHALLFPRAARRPRHRAPGCRCPDRRRDADGRPARPLDRLELGSRHHLRPRALGRKHGRAAAGARGTRTRHFRAGPHRDRLADRRRHRDGVRAGAPAGARRHDRLGAGRRGRSARPTSAPSRSPSG